MHGISSLEDAQPIVKSWLKDAGFVDEYGVRAIALYWLRVPISWPLYNAHCYNRSIQLRLLIAMSDDCIFFLSSCCESSSIPHSFGGPFGGLSVFFPAF